MIDSEWQETTATRVFLIHVGSLSQTIQVNPQQRLVVLLHLELSQEDINKKLYDDWISLSEQEKSEYEKISDKKDSFNKDAVLAGVRSVAGCRHASKFYVQLMISEVKLLDEGEY